MAIWPMRKPDVIIGGAEDPYMKRWHIVPRNPWFNIYLHHFLRSDDDRALHDHPWWNMSILLTGGYIEHLPSGPVFRYRGGIVWRPATAAHRIELDQGPVWTIFVTGPRVRQWGFHCPKGWRHWEEFVKSEVNEDGSIVAEAGRGCD